MSAVALYPFLTFGSPTAGLDASLCFDTRENSDAHVAGLIREGLMWFGEDADGRFNQSPADFAFVEFGAADFSEVPPWGDEEDEDEKVEFIRPDGSLASADVAQEGDEALNRVLWPALRTLVDECDAWSMLRRSEPFRLGVVMHDSEYAAFWRWPDDSSPG